MKQQALPVLGETVCNVRSWDPRIAWLCSATNTARGAIDIGAQIGPIVAEHIVVPDVGSTDREDRTVVSIDLTTIGVEV